MNNVPSAIEVVLADDHELVRSGIHSLLSGVAGVRVVAEVGDGMELLELLESIHPDVVLTDLAMPGVDGFTAIARLHERYPKLRIVVLSAQEDAESIKRAVAAGACGYVRKGSSRFELEMALRSVMATGSYFGGGVAQKLMEPTEAPPDDLLTDRQIEILTLLARGKSAKEIGYELGLSPKTVDAHRSRIVERLGLRDLASLTLYAVRKGLVKP